MKGKVFHITMKVFHCRFSNAGNWELVTSIVRKNLKEAILAYILKREIGYES